MENLEKLQKICNFFIISLFLFGKVSIDMKIPFLRPATDKAKLLYSLCCGGTFLKEKEEFRKNVIIFLKLNLARWSHNWAFGKYLVPTKNVLCSRITS